MSHEHLITVEPAPGGWRVMCDWMEPLMFLSGGRAEAQACALAASLAKVGDHAHVVIHDRGKSLVGKRRYIAR
jgi:hypothetical protein